MIQSNEQLVDELISKGYLRTPLVIKAFRVIDRKDFVLDPREAYLNEALSIGCSQTISQPLTVAFMLEQLQPQAGEKILDIGSGSGWKAALLSYGVGDQGRVISLEIIRELHEMAKINIGKYPELIKRVKLILANGVEGYEKEAPFDKIIAGAAGQAIPSAWLEQLKTGGRIVAPVEHEMVVMEKTAGGTFNTKKYPGFFFVPLVEE